MDIILDHRYSLGLPLDGQGQKHVLGFWEGGTKSHEVVYKALNQSPGLKVAI